MTDHHEDDQLRRLGLEPADLDGHTIEDLSDYLDAGRTPRNPAIEESPGCQLALDALERLRGLGSELMDDDAASAAPVDESWVDRILSGIAMDAQAGRRIPFASDDPAVELAITEGAVRGLVRAAEEAVPGVLVGRCRLDGDVTEPGAPVRVMIDASVRLGDPLRSVADRLRAEVDVRLRRHTELQVTAIDVAITDVREGA
ncbi:Asp23/Gls24 family envelope stress response protein [Microbacterium sp. Nx66]|uniref:hypothetical protein n=1 Tax=Microbacterium sp. Nx66 TaxID=2766784 RepID=UPI001656D3FD|nr:hypothetical protein [Microbacterium sp. Nx66]CAD5138269.1 Asp23/Gls24 family envelope stress response protein [Microbacterium sp. Nx66]